MPCFFFSVLNTTDIATWGPVVNYRTHTLTHSPNQSLTPHCLTPSLCCAGSLTLLTPSLPLPFTLSHAGGNTSSSNGEVVYIIVSVILLAVFCMVILFVIIFLACYPTLRSRRQKRRVKIIDTISAFQSFVHNES